MQACRMQVYRQHSQKHLKGVWVACSLIASLFLTACVTESSGHFAPEVSPDSAFENYLQLSRGYLEQGDLENARRHLVNAERFDTGSRRSSELHGIRALIHARQGDLAEAEASFQQALSLNEDDARTRNNYAAFLYSRARYDEAHTQLQEVVMDTDYSGRAQAFENLGLASLQLAREEEAIRAFRRALQLEPHQLRSILELAGLHYQRDELAQSQRYYNNYLTIQEFYDLSHSPQSLWLGIRLAREEQDTNREADYAGQLEAVYPDSIQNQIYRQSLSDD